MAFADLVNSIARLVDSAVIPLLYALAFILFLIGMVRFFFLGGEEQRQKGRVFMLWAVIGFVVLFSVWSIVRLFLGILPS
jgi:heme/copper-type cytochrome/quinol oxidase subunit 4